MFRLFLISYVLISVSFAESKTTINDWLGNQEFLDVSGSLSLYYRDLSNREENVAREEFGNAQVWLKAVTEEWNGLKLGISVLHNGEFADNENGFDASIADRKLALAELFASYTYSKTTLTIGRQVKGPDDGGWIMLDDFYEGVFINSSEIDGFNLRLTWVNRSAVFDPDEVTRYGEFNGDNDSDGVYGAEISWNQIEDLELSAVYYRANGAYSLAGGRAFYAHHFSENAVNEFLAEYYSTWENGGHGLGASATDGDDQAGIFHFNNTFHINDISIGAGFIKADRKLGSGSLINNPWDPFEEDDFHTQLANARTWYVNAAYQFIETVNLSLVYGHTKADTGDTEDADYRQLNVILAWEPNEQISVEAGYVHIDTDDGLEEGFDKFFINTIFSF